MTEYGYRRGFTGYAEWTNDDIDSGSIDQMLHNIELNNMEDNQ